MYRGGAARIEIGKPVVIVRTGAGPIGLPSTNYSAVKKSSSNRSGRSSLLERSCFGGATIDPEGRVVLVLDPARLISGGEHVAAPLEMSTAAAPGSETDVPFQDSPTQPVIEQKILLIDDSLSIRKFVGRMLESAGYEVDTAVDGEEGLRKASAQELSADLHRSRDAQAQWL